MARLREGENSVVNGVEQLAAWVTAHETLLSGLAAMLAIASIVPVVLRSIWRRRDAGAPAVEASRKRPSDGARPRIAVLPFEVASAAPDARIEAEIVRQELTTLLARSPGCEVLSSRAAASDARGAATGEGVVGARYAVEGGVRSTPKGFRVTASLVDTEEGRVTWTESFEAPIDGEVDRPRSLAERIASHLGVEIVRAEVGRARRRPRSRSARDLFLTAQGILFAEGHHRETYQRATGLLEQAVARDPDFAEAYGMLALLYALGDVFGFFEHSEAFREKVFGICRRALELDDRTSEVLGYVGCAYCDLRHYEQGLPLLERAIAVDPSNAQAKAALGSAYSSLNRLEDGIGMIESALDLSPSHKGIAAWATVLAGIYLQLDRQAEASVKIERALRCDPNFFPAHLVAALIAMGSGEGERARRHLAEAERIQPELSPGSLHSILGAAGARVIQGLRHAEG